MILAIIIAWSLTISADDTPFQQAMAMRRILTRGDCLTIKFHNYDFEACQGKLTGWVRVCDTITAMGDNGIGSVVGADQGGTLIGHRICWFNLH